ncbi:MAG: SpoIIE family protein phosphatase [Gaiellales bacterium]
MSGDATHAPGTDAAQIRARLELVVEVSEMLARAIDIGPALQGVARLATGWLCDLCAIDVLDDEGSPLRVALASSSGDLSTRPGGLWEQPADPASDLMRRVLEQHQVEIAPRPQGAADDQLTVVLPLASRGTVRGCMLICRLGAGHSFAPDDLAVAEDLARRVGLALESAALFDQVTAANRQARDLQRITDAALSAADLDTLLPAVLEPVVSVLGADTAGLLLVDERTEMLVEGASTTVDVGSREWPRIPLGEGVLGRIAAGSGPVAVERMDAAELRSGVVAAQHIRSLAGAPLRVGDRTVGVIYVGTSGMRAFRAAELGLLGRVAARVALAVAHARSFSAEQVARDRLTLLARLGEVLLGDSFDVRVALDELVEALVPRMADWCSITLAGRPPTTASAGQGAYASRWQHLPAELERSPAVSGAARDGRAYLHTWASPADAEEADAGPDGVRSVMIVPLVARAQAMGVMTLVRGVDSAAYDGDDLAFAQELAGRLATALDTARVYRERDAVARTLQRSLLPPSLPSIQGIQMAAVYHPAGAGDVGGDFYDVFEAADGGWFLVVGDVCGKGAEAAALTGLVRHSIRAVALNERRPSRVLKLVNQTLMGEVSDYRFCTVAAARLDVTPDGAIVRVACAGHPPPLVIGPGGRIDVACGPGTLLGVFSDPQLQERQATLGAGDSLVLYTDGVTEIRRDGHIFGEDRLRGLLAESRDLAPAMIADHVERAVLEYKAGAPDDDVALLVVKRTTHD